MQQLNSNGHAGVFRARVLPAFVLALVTATAASEAFACAACGSTLSRDWETQGISGNQGFVAELTYDYLNQNQQRYGTAAASPATIDRQLNAGQEIEAYTKTQTVTATLIYNDDTWGVGVQVPYVKRTHGTYGNTAPLGSGYSTSSDSSIGDIRVTGRYTGLSEQRNAGLIAGVKFPTGNTGANFNAGVGAGMPLDAGLQIGTGSTDIILGGYTTGAFDHYGWFVQGTVQHAIMTQKALGNLDYRPGDAYMLNTGVRYAGFGAKVSPMLQLNIIKRQADSGAFTVPLDPLTGVPVSGGTLAYVAPGVSVRLGGGTSVYGFVQLPVYQNVNSLQITPKYTVTLGARQSF